jgi:hypothetical protein
LVRFPLGNLRGLFPEWSIDRSLSRFHSESF